MSKIDLIKNKFNSNKITTIVNAIDLENYNFSVSPDRIKNQLSLHNGTFIVGAIGRLIEDKGFKYFIDSFKKVYRNIPNVKFLIVGDGPERINLESLRTVRNFKDKIIFTGFRDDIQQTYACLDVLVQPSLLEGFSGVLLEGMAMRKPVIATEACGDMNLFKHLENIVIVKPADSDAIADAIITLYKDRSLREKIALNGCNFVENKFNASLWSDKYLNVFSELVAKRKC
jgi:glycosyltransferase involved in cell wall biosynthesis